MWIIYFVITLWIGSVLMLLREKAKNRCMDWCEVIFPSLFTLILISLIILLIGNSIGIIKLTTYETTIQIS